ncbi:MAG: DUF4338 domain-containing protein [Chromatiaceae bacterium]
MLRRYCGRDFAPEELALIRRLIAEDLTATRADLSRRLCERIGWYKADGGLKEMSARVAMLRMQDDGLIRLPPPTGARPQSCIRATAATDPGPALAAPVHALPPLQLVPVRQRTHSQLWNEYIHRYHYLGYATLPGAQLRYFVTAGEQLLALLGFGASAWQCAPRDHYIGWSHTQRTRNLHLVVNNARFLILPWIRSKNLASKILALAARTLPEHWQQRYAYCPVLMETFVDTERFAGTCYRAANWQHIGQTKGRGKLGPSGKRSVPIKDLWLYPLDPDFRRLLTLD